MGSGVASGWGQEWLVGGVRFRCYLHTACVPPVCADYTFWMSSTGESTTMSSQQMKLMAWVSLDNNMCVM